MEQIEQALALMQSQGAEWDALAAGRAPITINAVALPVSKRHYGRKRLCGG